MKACCKNVESDLPPRIDEASTYTPSSRIRRLEAAARKRFIDAPPSPKNDNMFRAFFELYKDVGLRERQARTYAFALTHEPIVISPDERIHGVFHRKASGDPFCGYGPNLQWAEFSAQFSARQRIERELPELLPYFHSTTDGLPPRTFIINEEGTPGHIAWRWDWVLRDGLDAIIARHREAADAVEDSEARAYYQGVVIGLKAILEWNRRHVEAMEAMLESGECTPEQRQSLAQCAAVMRQVPAQPARTFHEALQAYHFMWVCAFYEGPYGGNSPGRFDFLLWPFLRKEYENGEIQAWEVTELVAETFIKCDEVVHSDDGSVLTIVTGGLDRDLQDAVNPLTYRIIDAIEALDITHPAVYNRISTKNPQAYRERCHAYMLRGHNRAQFLNEEAILQAMTRDGYMPAADAAMYICGGCMEINPQGLTSDLFWSFRYNICKTLELCITGGEDLVDGSQRLPLSTSLAEHETFESFYGYFEKEVEKVLLLKFKALDIAAQEIAQLRPQFVISSMVEDCFTRGRNQMQGGARYADYGGSLIGIPNVANSLMAIQEAIYEQSWISGADLIRALKVNFAGHELLRKRLQQLPKYGEQNPRADALMNRLLHSISRIFDSYTTLNGGKCKQVLLTFSFAPAFGAALGATPEGNLAGTPVAHGLTPVNTAPGTGLSTAMQSYLGLDNEQVTGGASTMWDLDADWINESLLESVYSVFEDGGGQIFQGNMTDVETLEKALLDPRQYPELIVRVGGFSSRFMNLAPDVQREIISRKRWK